MTNFFKQHSFHFNLNLGKSSRKTSWIKINKQTKNIAPKLSLRFRKKYKTAKSIKHGTIYSRKKKNAALYTLLQYLSILSRKFFRVWKITIWAAHISKNNTHLVFIIIIIPTLVFGIKYVKWQSGMERKCGQSKKLHT